MAIPRSIYRYGSAIKWKSTFENAISVLHDLKREYRPAPLVVVKGIYGSGKSTALEYLFNSYGPRGLIVQEGDIILALAIGYMRGVSSTSKIAEFARVKNNVFELSDEDKKNAVAEFLRSQKMDSFPFHVCSDFKNCTIGRRKDEIVTAAVVARYTFWKVNLQTRKEAMLKDGFPIHRLVKDRILSEQEYTELLLSRFRDDRGELYNIRPILNYGDDELFEACLNELVIDYFYNILL
jgi:hypothetical protein